MARKLKKQPTPEQIDALRWFAKKHGHKWKSKLCDIWLEGRDEREPEPYSHLLRQVRNRLGPAWLMKFSWSRDCRG